MHRLYSPSSNLYVDFDITGLVPAHRATKFDTYDQAHDAAVVVDAHGWDVRIVDDSHQPREEAQFFRNYGEYQQALWAAVR